MRTARVRAGWLMTAAATLGMVAPAPAQRIQQDRSVARSAPATPPAQAAETPVRQAEMQVELAWLADPLTFPCMLAAHVENGAMVVGGEVPSPAVRQKAVALAREQGGLPVLDRLTVKANASPAAIKATDGDLCRHAITALSKKCPEFLAHIQIEAGADGQLIVKGSVPTYDAKLAISRRLSQLAGCTSVYNELILGPVVVAGPAPAPTAAAGKTPPDKVPAVAATAGKPAADKVPAVAAAALPRPAASPVVAPHLLPPAPVPVEDGPALAPPVTAAARPVVGPPVAIGSVNRPVLPGDKVETLVATPVPARTNTGSATLAANPPTALSTSLAGSSTTQKVAPPSALQRSAADTRPATSPASSGDGSRLSPYAWATASTPAKIEKPAPTVNPAAAAAAPASSTSTITQRVAPYQWAASAVPPTKPAGAETAAGASPSRAAALASASPPGASLIASTERDASTKGPILQASATVPASSRDEGSTLAQAVARAATSTPLASAGSPGKVEALSSSGRAGTNRTVAQAPAPNALAIQGHETTPLPRGPALSPGASGSSVPVMAAAVQQMLQQRLELVCADKAWEVRVQPRSSNALAVHMKVHDPMTGRQLAQQILKLPELGPYQVKMEVLVMP